MQAQHWLALGMAGGALVGAAAGLLLAPKSGKEARRVLSSRAGKLRRWAKRSEHRYGAGEPLDHQVGASA